MSESALYISPGALVARWRGRITEKTLANWRQDGLGPKHTKIGGRVAYSIADVEAYEDRPGFPAWFHRRRRRGNRHG